MIVRYPSDILYQESLPVYDNLSYTEIDALKSKMRMECWNVGGFGISAIQIGEPYRIFGLLSPKKKDLIWICDPEIIGMSGTSFFKEGCLSIPGYFWNIARHKKVTLSYINSHGKRSVKTFDDIESRVIQHEMDHLDGILIPDLMNDSDRENFENFFLNKKNIDGYIPPEINVV